MRSDKTDLMPTTAKTFEQLLPVPKQLALDLLFRSRQLGFGNHELSIRQRRYGLLQLLLREKDFPQWYDDSICEDGQLGENGNSKSTYREVDPGGTVVDVFAEGTSATGSAYCK